MAIWQLAVVLLAIASVEGLESRIVGGRPTTIAKHPYMVAVHYHNKHHCGGSLIHREWVLTAAHCVYGLGPIDLTVRVGSTYTTKLGKVINVAKIIHHGDFEGLTNEYDIAVLKLSTPVTLGPNVKLLPLATATSPLKPGVSAVATGWGRISPDPWAAMSDHLETIVVKVIDQEVCKNAYKMVNFIAPYMVCAGYMKGGKDTCRGDSGGPLVYKGVQVGVVSWGEGCAKTGYPGVYTRVSAFRNWIKESTNI